eukprot:67631-Chlamydomonas_euryale.AAC.6
MDVLVDAPSRAALQPSRDAVRQPLSAPDVRVKSEQTQCRNPACGTRGKRSRIRLTIAPGCARMAAKTKLLFAECLRLLGCACCTGQGAAAQQVTQGQQLFGSKHCQPSRHALTACMSYDTAILYSYSSRHFNCQLDQAGQRPTVFASWHWRSGGVLQQFPPDGHT